MHVTYMYETDHKYSQKIALEIFSKLRKTYSSMRRNNERNLYNRWSWQSKSKATGNTTLIIFFFFLLVAVLVFARWIDSSSLSGVYSSNQILTKTTKAPKKPETFPLNCAKGNETQVCPTTYPTTQKATNPNHSSSRSCPSYFRWIHEDLRPWKETGITRDMVERAQSTANFRLVIVNGKAYIEKYRQSIQTRDKFTLWGILQLLRLYPGRLPDLELMFDCDDRPVIRSDNFRGPNAGTPPLFRYCGDDSTLDIVFPDWSFWGWAEINIKPWSYVLEDTKEGNKKTKWKDRVPYAYWKGNPHVTPTRKDLLKCNASHEIDWNTRLYIQDWDEQSRKGFKDSDVGDQCTHRYKIYVEGWAWSVSEKYIMACDSMNLYIKPHFYDFFIRDMVPLHHYWPIRDTSKCTSLKFAVEWGNNHTHQAEGIGKASSKFIQENLKMEYVYDYMFHLLNQYAKLLKFKPSIPTGAVELCSETMACKANGGTWSKFMVDSLVDSPAHALPCNLPPPYDPQLLHHFLQTKSNLTRQVEIWEDEYWQNLNKNQ